MDSNIYELITLAVDSTATTASAAVLRGRSILGVTSVNGVLTHSETLLPMCDALLRDAGIKISDVGLFACSAGPGSFTGVRIGVSMIKGLAYPKNVPCAGVSTLEALAYNLRGVSCGALIVPVMDARRSQLYNAVFTESDGRIVRIKIDRLTAFDALCDELESTAPDRKIMFVGDGYDLVMRKLAASGREELKSRVKATPPLLIRQNAASVALLAVDEYERGNYTTEKELSPVYLRMSQAERERRERESKGTV